MCCSPFVPSADAAGGGGASATDQVFRYTATGAEGASFNVNLPAVRASTNYAVFVTMGDAATALAIRLPQTGRTTALFPVQTSAAVTAGDIFEFLVKDLT